MEIGLTQREVARRAGISQSTLSDIERGEITGRSLEVLASLARIFNVSADYLLDLPADEVRYPSVRGLTPGEAVLIDLVRGLGVERRRLVTNIARMLRDEDARHQRYAELVTAIDALDTTGLLERSQDRLLFLAGELGSIRAAVTTLAGELGLADDESQEALEES
jgi:transcriptional regulator with XRE-family HTH domain